MLKEIPRHAFIRWRHFNQPYSQLHRRTCVEITALLLTLLPKTPQASYAGPYQLAAATNKMAFNGEIATSGLDQKLPAEHGAYKAADQHRHDQETGQIESQ